MKRLIGCLLLALAMILGPTAAQAHASDYDGRDRDGGYSYRHHRGDDDYRDRGEYSRHYGDDGGYRGYDDDRDDDGYNGNRGDCQSGGCGNRSRRCDRSSGDCRSSFSPGPFKDSPVVICFPMSCNGDDGGGDGDRGPGPGKRPPPKERTSLACLVPVPYHCDPKP